MKHRITLTAVVEYEIDPKYYSGCTTDEERLAVDLSQALDDPFGFMNYSMTTVDVTGEVIKTEL